MAEKLPQLKWGQGIANRVQRSDVPEGFVHDMLNLVPTAGGRLSLRPGMDPIYTGTDVSAVAPFFHNLLLLDDRQLVELDPSSGATKVRATDVNARTVCTAQLADRMFVLAGDHAYSFTRTEQVPWGADLYGDFIAQHRGMIAVGRGASVYVTAPFTPDEHDPIKGSYQFPGEVRFVLGAESGIVVGHAHGVEIIDGAGSEEPTLNSVSEIPPHYGTGTRTGAGRIMWMTNEGLMELTSQADTTRLGATPVNQGAFAPSEHDRSRLMTFDANGSSLAVAVPTGTGRVNGLATHDYYEAEVIPPGGTT